MNDIRSMGGVLPNDSLNVKKFLMELYMEILCGGLGASMNELTNVY